MHINAYKCLYITGYPGPGHSPAVLARTGKWAFIATAIVPAVLAWTRLGLQCDRHCPVCCFHKKGRFLWRVPAIAKGLCPGPGSQLQLLRARAPGPGPSAHAIGCPDYKRCP